MSNDSSWQVLLADLSLILFLSTAAALASEQDENKTPILNDATPVAQHRLRSGGPSLGEWLATQPDDPRLRLTLVIPFDPTSKQSAIERAEQLAIEARRHDKFARVVIEPTIGPGSGKRQPLAILTYEGEQDGASSKGDVNPPSQIGTGLAQ